MACVLVDMNISFVAYKIQYLHCSSAFLCPFQIIYNKHVYSGDQKGKKKKG